MAKKGSNGGSRDRKPSDGSGNRRSYINQADIAAYSLRDALRVSQALTDDFAGGPAAPHQVAMALELSPTSSAWQYLAGSSAAYKLTKGSARAGQISLEDLGRRATAPVKDGDEIRAIAEAALGPKVFEAFFRKYDKSNFPKDNIAKNVLQQDYSVPKDRCEDALRILKDNGQFAGFILYSSGFLGNVA
jgi:hypothetical protein